MRAMTRLTTTQKPTPKRLTLTSTTNERGEIHLAVQGEYGTIRMYFEPGPYVSIPDYDRPAEEGAKYKAVFGIEVDGKVSGWFVARKGKTGWLDRLVFIPSMQVRKSIRKPTPAKPRKPRQRLAKTRQAAKIERVPQLRHADSHLILESDFAILNKWTSNN